MNSSTKKCNKCHVVKSIDCFHRKTKSIDGYEYCCKECKKTYDKQYKLSNICLIKEYKEKKYERAAYYRKKECEILGIETSLEKFFN